MNQQIEADAYERKHIVIRLLYTIFFLIVFEIIKIALQISVIFQYIYLLITRRPSMPMRQFSNRLSAYAYRVIRYATLNENTRPFPFADFPEELHPPDTDIHFR